MAPLFSKPRIFSKPRLWCLDFVGQGDFEVVHFPFVIGSGPGSDLRIENQDVLPKHCAFVESGGRKWLMKLNLEAQMSLNGQPFGDRMEIGMGQDYSLKIGDRFLMMRLDKEAEAWCARSKGRQRVLYHLPSNGQIGFQTLEELPPMIEQFHFQQSDCVVCLDGMQAGFFAGDLIETLSLGRTAEPVNGFDGEFESAAREKEEEIDGLHGELLCPICWKRFDRRHIMHIAQHPDLLGDPVLGPDHALRFLATDFNARHQAMDPKGVACADVACPHCRRRLPAGFWDIACHLFSIVGVPSAGKSYFLATLIRMLRERMAREFGLAFTDADAAHNTVLAYMEKRLFSGSPDPEQLYLAKTKVQGEMTEMWERDGRRVPLPKPFSYLVSGDPLQRLGASPFITVFYDNAGEHFEAGRGYEESISAQHVVCCDGILFLFDPTCNTGFRQRLPDGEDAQLRDVSRLDQQEEVLAHMRNRIRSELGLTPSQKIGTRMAFLVGKCDTWLHLLGPESPAEAVHDGTLDLEAIDENSRRVRHLLQDMCPSMVANIESVFEEVRYFPISALGHSPRPFKPSDSDEMRLGPVPGRIKPVQVEIPMLWMLHRLYPALIPAAR